MKKCSNEDGMLIVEATIVFPVMFLVILLMICLGNVYYQKCRVEAFVNELAIAGAAYCADPMLNSIENSIEDGTIPSFDEVDIKPYRYFFGNSDIDVSELKAKINDMNTGLFWGMKPKISKLSSKFINGYIYSTFEVAVKYEIELPVRLLGMSDFFSIDLASYANFPVSDTMEFIRNADMIEDYMEKFGVMEKINELIDTAKKWMGK